ncbi:RagB/SusD family nutrient uptake outer membrane protein [Adhaeribacter arboris]|uniref:RagB/SusD family nutrient uptake outer membrane protein n=1 Tax=Adhaeribacter arboris TaxID=2072846 RepID=A0A2T2YBE8_9BACT|nr:RagB/SusD family nutrient uptake outer membrane protein [Adhaeribacter arboris]PSR52823.1 RagB/SusD family nutrient uptake outer membrane protein [Adhaeribacter arboris]
MKRNIGKVFIVAAFILASGCKDYLDYEPRGTLTADQLTTPDKVDQLVTAAYAAIGNDFWDGSITSMWTYGSVRSDDAYKGGGSVGDVGEYNNYEQYNLVTPTTVGNANNTWARAYGAISRANFALQALNNLTDAQFANKKVRQGELRFLRGHLHFVLKVIFKNVPYIDETLSEADILKVSNRQYTNDELWNKIAEDFQAAIDNLPDTQPEVGRANKLAAKAYLAKVRLYQAYQQDETHKVTSIDPQRLNEVVALTTDVINSGKYSLQPDFAENFLYGYDNAPESVFAVQFSINDGTAIGRLSMATSLNYSLAPQYGCCWFHLPSQNMVNAFTTTNNGLPQFDTFNDKVITDADLTPTGVPVDPRIDHTIGILGHPFKYNPSILYDHSWERVSALYGGFGNMKEQQEATSPSFKKVGPFYGSAKNIDIIRYADVLLWQAEALIELGRQNEALPLINQIRARAKNSTGRTQLANGKSPSNYNISEYANGTNITWTQENARKALQWERRLEFAMESPRFFDLVRWGIAAETLNKYLEVEKTRRTFLSAAVFTKGRDEYFPIPQREIDFTKGLYVQNPGY